MAIKVPKFKKASRAAAWIAKSITTKTWTQGAMARDRTGVVVDVEDPKATSFCALGWIDKADQGMEEKLRAAFRDATRCSNCIDDYNDDSYVSYKHIRQAFRDAAKLLKAKEA